MNASRLRKIGAAAILGFLAFFFLPVLYSPTLFPCGGGTVCLTVPSGLESMGYRFLNWGVSYSFEPGAGNLGFSTIGVDSLPPQGALITYIFPLMTAFVGLLAPEIVRLSKATRFGFAAFGSFVAVLASLFIVVSWISTVTAIGVVLVPVGACMVAFGMRVWIFRPDDPSG